ncbi:hypothetical protein CSUI_010570 [Cystoisospora suis]|uniref:Uncharacterized protein n=1 Tax=Cystoisospora suis TaxID=483139 RepID=A0A2C6JAK6_9APIC|nr:hypothetical protein CSUI_010570 [Cystoisospora suis]
MYESSLERASPVLSDNVLVFLFFSLHLYPSLSNGFLFSFSLSLSYFSDCFEFP